MMLIRQDQIQSFDKLSESEFESRLALFIGERYPARRAQAEEEFRSELRWQIDAARRYGFRTERQVATYVVAAWVFGPNYDRELHWVEEVLHHPFLSREEKTECLAGFADARLMSMARTERDLPTMGQ